MLGAGLASAGVAAAGQPDAEQAVNVHDRMAEALMRAQHPLTFAHGHIAHDGKPKHSYDLDFSKELRFIEETLKLANVQPRVLHPLT